MQGRLGRARELVADARWDLGAARRQVQARGALRRANPGMGRVDHRARIEIRPGTEVSIGRGSTIDAFAVVWVTNHRSGEGVPSALRIGERSAIGEYCNIRATGGTITIGDDVLLGQRVSLVASNHRVDAGQLITELPWDTERTGITVGNGVWLAAHVVVLPGVTIGDGAVIGAGAVVTADVAPNAIVAGVPARQLRLRT